MVFLYLLLFFIFGFGFVITLIDAIKGEASRHLATLLFVLLSIIAILTTSTLQAFL